MRRGMAARGRAGEDGAAKPPGSPWGIGVPCTKTTGGCASGCGRRKVECYTASMRRSAIITLLTVLAIAILPRSPEAKTIVDTKGTSVTLTIPVDVVDESGGRTRDGIRQLVKDWEDILTRTWETAFDRLPYRNCYRLKIKLKLTPRPPGFKSTKGTHRVLVSAPTSRRTFDGAGFDGVPETSRDPITNDGTRSFENSRDGAIPADAPETVVAHEFGHLLGLGDDREGGAPKSGRDGTMMVGGVPGVDLSKLPKIDKDLVDRIGRVIEKHLANQNQRLAGCETDKIAPPPPWLQPPAGCTPRATTIYVTGIITDMTKGEAKCSRSLSACGDDLGGSAIYNPYSDTCPFTRKPGSQLAFSKPGPGVCCAEWEKAKRSKVPCDPLLDADCDGIPNQEDIEPLTPATPAP